MEIYHQLGYNSIWNIESLNNDKTADGLIFAPRYINNKKILKLDANLKKTSIFDPQFFLPNISRGELSSYDFFPNNIGNGFNTVQYSDSFADDCAKNCIQYQISNDFRYIVIPARYLSGMPSNFTDMQENLFVKPFLKEINRIKPNKPVLLQVILNNDMLLDDEYLSDKLNWITKFKEISGVYLICERPIKPKQIKDIDLLYSILHVIDVLNNNSLEVILGYLNVESLLLSIASPKAITMGSYENLRMFNIKAFQEKIPSKQQGPTPRIYMSKLLQSVDHRYIGAIRRAFGNDDIFDVNNYQALMFQKSYRWNFNKSELYKHYFLELSKQLSYLNTFSGQKRYLEFCHLVDTARNNYNHLNKKGVILEDDSDGTHLDKWLTAANQYAEIKGWR